jgi:hypothetical protein
VVTINGTNSNTVGTNVPTEPVTEGNNVPTQTAIETANIPTQAATQGAIVPNNTRIQPTEIADLNPADRINRPGFLEALADFFIQKKNNGSMNNNNELREKLRLLSKFIDQDFKMVMRNNIKIAQIINTKAFSHNDYRVWDMP